MTVYTGLINDMQGLHQDELLSMQNAPVYHDSHFVCNGMNQYQVHETGENRIHFRIPQSPKISSAEKKAIQGNKDRGHTPRNNGEQSFNTCQNTYLLKASVEK